MKCIVFNQIGVTPAEIQYNNWAKNQTLTKDMIIHTHYAPETGTCYGSLIIVVFYDERIHPTWSP